MKGLVRLVDHFLYFKRYDDNKYWRNISIVLCWRNSYMILAPAIMTQEKDPKVAAAKCLESVQLDPESYRIGHTKASSNE